MLVMGGVYFGSVLLALKPSPVPLSVMSPLWPSTGVAVVGLYRLGLSRWPVIIVSALLAGQLLHAPLSAVLVLAGLTTCEAALGAWLLRHLRFGTSLARIQDVLLFAAVIVACTLASVVGTAGVSALAWLQDPNGSLVGAGPLVWREWPGAMLGALSVGPVLLFLAEGRPEPRWGEAGVLALLVLGTSLWSFSAASSAQLHVQVFLLFPLAVWASLRFGPRGVALTSLIVVAVCCAFSEQGPFNGRVPEMQFFLGVTVFSGMFFAAAQAERAQAHGQMLLLATAVRGVRDGVVIVEMREEEGTSRPVVVYANESFLEMVGQRLEDVVERSPAELFARGPVPESHQRLITAARRGEFFSGEIILQHREGAHVSTDMLLSPVRGEDGRVAYLVGTHRDTTADKQLQAKLVAAERIAAVGTLAAGVGHEINNPLAYLLLNLDSAARSLKKGPEEDIRARLESVRESAERIRLIARDLKVFSRQEGEERAMMDLNDVVVPALRMASHQVRARARLVEQLGRSPRVMGCESRLGQVMLNLLVNALQAIPEGQPERHEVRVRTGEDALGRALVEVSDTGCGIAPGVLAHIFDPFFTTKPSGEGTGLGLAICQQIIQSHGGELRVRSEPGKGSVFTVHLPAAHPEFDEPSPEAPIVFHTPSRRRILVIDDEPRLAQSMRMLIEPTHEVVVTTRGAEALTWVDAGQHFDLVLCDLQMPETSGIDIHAHLKEHAPELAERLVFISGGAYTQVMRDFVRVVSNRVLEKPVRPEELLATIDEALATKSAA